MAQLPSHATAQFRHQGSANIVGGVCLSRLQQGATYLGPRRYICSAEFRSVGAHHPAFTPAWPTPQTRPGEAWRPGRRRVVYRVRPPPGRRLAPPPQPPRLPLHEGGYPRRPMRPCHHRGCPTSRYPHVHANMQAVHHSPLSRPTLREAAFHPSRMHASVVSRRTGGSQALRITEPHACAASQHAARVWLHAHTGTQACSALAAQPWHAGTQCSPGPMGPPSLVALLLAAPMALDTPKKGWRGIMG